MNFALWTSFAIISAVNIVTPGPANLNTARRTIQLGGKRVVPAILGNALGLAVGGAVCAFGIVSFVMSSTVFWTVFNWLGGAYLAWLGLRLIFTTDVLLLEAANDEVVKPHTLFREAFLLAVTNPKALLFYMAMFPQVLEPARGMALQTSILIGTYCGLSILSLSTYSALAHILRNWFMTPVRYTRFRQLSGLILIGFAIKLLLL